MKGLLIALTLIVVALGCSQAPLRGSVVVPTGVEGLAPPFAALGGLASADTDTSDATPQPPWREHRNEAFGFAMRYPPSWVVDQEGNTTTLTANPSDSKISILIIVSQRDELSAEGLMNELMTPERQRYEDFEAFTPEEFSLGGITGLTADYLFTDKAGELIYNTVVVAIRQGRGYQIQVQAPRGEYESLLGTINGILESFRWVDSSTETAPAWNPTKGPWSWYHSEALGVRLQYPATWVVREQGMEVTFSSVDTVPGPAFTVMLAPAEGSPSELVQRLLRERSIRHPDLTPAIRRSFPLGQSEMVTVEHTYTDERGRRVREALMATSVGKGVYSVRLIAADSSYTSALRTFVPMLDSLTIIRYGP